MLALLLPLEQPLSAMYLQDLLTPLYSASGSNLRLKEESVFHHWVEYLQDAQGNVIEIVNCFLYTGVCKHVVQ